MSDYDERILLGLLLEHDRMAAVELERVLGGDDPRVRVEDALAALERDGLANRHGPMAWPTRAVRRALELSP